VQRPNRLRKGSEFDTVYSKGTVVGGPLLVVRWLPNDLGAPRWGFAVGKRLAKQAAKRNRTKRRLKASADALQLRQSIDMVVTARSGAIQASQAELRRALEKALTRAGILPA
jgi:ribonuclease P protein component